MTVITISRQMGSLGCSVAEEIANCLGYRVMWREVINEAASRASVPEVALATIDELDLLGIRPTDEAVEAYHQAVRDIMQETYQKGNVVIVGRAGQVILRGAKGVIHARIVAPFELRVDRIAKQHNIKPEVARKQVRASDESRKRYLNRYYETKLDDTDLYDVIINTARFDVQTAASIICRAVEHQVK
jgi:cytidylate kinase